MEDFDFTTPEKQTPKKSTPTKKRSSCDSSGDLQYVSPKNPGDSPIKNLGESPSPEESLRRKSLENNDFLASSPVKRKSVSKSPSKPKVTRSPIKKSPVKKTGSSPIKVD